MAVNNRHNFSMEYIIVSLAFVFFLGHGLQWLFMKTKVPDLLILIAIGFIAGPVLGLINPSDFGKVGSVLTTLALVVILYDGGLNLNTRDLVSSSLPAALLSLAGAILIGIVAFLMAYIVAAQEWYIALLFALGIGSTSAAVVMPMVRFLSASKRAKTILSLESAFTDVLAIVCFLVILDGVIENKFSFQEILVGIGPKTLSSVLMGIGFGLVWSFLKRKFSPLRTMTFAGEAWALFTFGLIEIFDFNGAMGVLALGFTLANMNLMPDWLLSTVEKDAVTKNEISLLGELTLILKTVFFIYLGIILKFSDLTTVLFGLIISLCIFITRFFCIQLLMSKDEYSRLDAMIMTAMGPRGLAAAVLASLPLQKGIEGGHFIQDSIFAIIPISILFSAIFVMLSERESFRLKAKTLFYRYKENGNGNGNEATAIESTDS